MMLTSFFGKSNPVNFLLLSIFIAVVMILHAFLGFGTTFHWTDWLLLGAHIVVQIFSMLLLDFIIRKNNLTQPHTLGIFVYVCWALCLPLFLSWTMVLAQAFVLLALRRIFSLTSERKTEKKIFDASFWILLASYFYFWAILLFLALYIAIANKPHKNLRHFFIPVVGTLGMFLLVTAFFLLKEGSFQWFLDWPQKVSLHFVAYGSLHTLLFITVITTLFIWTLIFRISQLGEVPKKQKSNYKLVIYCALIGGLMALVSPVKLGPELLFFIAPSAIMVAGYLEKKGDVWFKELLLWGILVLPWMLLWG